MRYEYDVEDPIGFGSDNNRLMYYETWDHDELEPHISTTYYYYNDCGNVTRVVTHEEGTTNYTSTWLEYARNGKAVTYVLGETWELLGDPPVLNNYDITYAREFRYDGARQRYLNRELDPVKIQEDPPDYTPNSEVWSDYDGNTIYGDFTVAGSAFTQVRSFEPGIGRLDWMDGGSGPWVPDPTSTSYYHADMLGTTRIMTDAAGNGFDEAGYSAFGQLQFGSTVHRYGYAGAWGYQAATSDNPSDPYLDFTFLHVGHRYYDPATGSFLQRDPIGIVGGLNTYAYVLGKPTISVDPEGELIVIIGIVSAIAGGVKAATAYYSYKSAAEIADACQPATPKTNEELQEYFRSRERALRGARPGIQGTIENMPGSSITGSPAPSTDAAEGIVEVIGAVAG